MYIVGYEFSFSLPKRAKSFVNQQKARLGLIPAMLAVSSAALFIRLADATPVATAFWRGAIAGLCFLPLYFWPKFRQEFRSVEFQQFGKIAASVILICLHQLCFISSLKYTTVAAATFLTCTQPVFTAIFGSLLIKEKVSARSLLCLGGALVGMALITLSHKAETISDNELIGNILAITAAILASFFILIARKLRQKTPLVPFMSALHVSGSLFIGLIALVTQTNLFSFSSQTWTGLLLLGLIPTLIGHSLLNYAIGHMKAFAVNAAILAEPVGATVLAAIFLNETPSALTLAGGAVIIICVLLIIFEKEKQELASDY